MASEGSGFSKPSAVEYASLIAEVSACDTTAPDT